MKRRSLFKILGGIALSPSLTLASFDTGIETYSINDKSCCVIYKGKIIASGDYYGINLTQSIREISTRDSEGIIDQELGFRSASLSGQMFDCDPSALIDIFESGEQVELLFGGEYSSNGFISSIELSSIGGEYEKCDLDIEITGLINKV